MISHAFLWAFFFMLYCLSFLPQEFSLFPINLKFLFQFLSFICFRYCFLIEIWLVNVVNHLMNIFILFNNIRFSSFQSFHYLFRFLMSNDPLIVEVGREYSIHIEDILYSIYQISNNNFPPSHIRAIYSKEFSSYWFPNCHWVF